MVVAHAEALDQTLEPQLGDVHHRADVAHVGDHGRVRLRFLGVELPLKMRQQLDVFAVHLGISGVALGERNMVGRRGERSVIELGLLVHYSVHDQVGVPANRRSKVCVVVLGQPVVADRLRRVASAFHAAQVADPEDVRKQVALEAREKFAGLFLVGQVAGAQPHQRRPRPEVVELLGVRLVVDAMNRLDASPLDFLRDSLVGQQHEFLDQLVRHVVLHPAHLAQSPIGIEQHLVLRHVEIQRARPEARLPQFLRETMGVVQHALDVAGRFATEDRHRLFIRKTAFRADNRRVKLCLLDLPVPAQHELHAARQPIHPRLERAQLVAQFLGQHRDDAVNEIRRVAALPRLLVERALGGDVV